jgi:hypothetical protein
LTRAPLIRTVHIPNTSDDQLPSASQIVANIRRKERREQRARKRTETMEREARAQPTEHANYTSNSQQLPIQKKRNASEKQGNSSKRSRWGLELEQSTSQQIASTTVSSICGQPAEQHTTSAELHNDLQLPVNFIKPAIEPSSSWTTDCQSSTFFSDDLQHSPSSRIQNIVKIEPQEGTLMFERYKSDTDVIALPSPGGTASACANASTQVRSSSDIEVCSPGQVNVILIVPTVGDSGDDSIVGTRFLCLINYVQMLCHILSSLQVAMMCW